MDEFNNQSEAAHFSSQAKAWFEARVGIYEATTESRAALIPISSELAISSWWYEKLDVTDLVAMHGVGSVFMGVKKPASSVVPCWDRGLRC